MQLGAHDLERMTRFYDAMPVPLGLMRSTDLRSARWPQFAINRPLDGQAVMALGASGVGRRGLRERNAPDFYAAYCRAPEGHKLCFVHTGDPSTLGNQTRE